MPTDLAYREAAPNLPPTPAALMVNYVKQSPDLMAGIRRGVTAMKAGRVKAWKEVKRELGLG